MKAREHAAAIAFVLVASLVSAPAFADDDEPTVGIIVSAQINTAPDTANLVASSMARALSEELQVRAITGHRLAAALPDEAKTVECLADLECKIRAAEALDVDQLLMLVVVRVSDRLKVEATWVDPQARDSALRDPIEVDSGHESLDATFRSAAEMILPSIPPRQPEVAPIDTDDTTGGSGSGSGSGELLGSSSPPQPEPRGRHMTAGSWTMMGLGTVLLGSGGYFTYRSIKEDGKPESSFRRWLTYTADGLVISGLAALTVGTVLYWRSGDESVESRPATTVGIDVRPDSMGLVVGGEF